MDVDPKPVDQSPEPADGPETVNESPSFNNPQPTGAPSPLIMAALDQEDTEHKEPQTQPETVINPAHESKSKRGIIAAIVIALILILAGTGWYVLMGPGATKTTSNTSTTTDQSTLEATTPETAGATIDDATDELTGSAADEATSAATDDSATSTDDSTSAGNVGDSINENNL
jgi:cytoskeletal protein RodZ